MVAWPEKPMPSATLAWRRLPARRHSAAADNRVVEAILKLLATGAYAFYDTSQVAGTAIELFEKGVVLMPADRLQNLLPGRDSD
jgi:hypothetical protein